MEDINRFLSDDVIEEIYKDLRKENNDLLLKFKVKDRITDEYVYHDDKGRSHGSHSFILFRNVFTPINENNRRILAYCRHFNLENSVAHYAMDLFDKFFTYLISKARERGFFSNYGYDVDLKSDFGAKMLQMHRTIKPPPKRLYKFLHDEYAFGDYGQIVCMVMCIVLASKQHETEHLTLSQASDFLLHYGNVPHDFCHKQFLAFLEIKMLNLLNFDFKMNSLKTYVESFMLILIRYYFQKRLPVETVNRMNQVSVMLVENFYMMQLPFLIQVFTLYRERQFNFCFLEDVESIENYSRDKLLLAMGIIAATCTCSIEIMPFEKGLLKSIYQYLARISGIEVRLIERLSNCVLKHLYDAPREEVNKQKLIADFSPLSPIRLSDIQHNAFRMEQVLAGA